MNIYEQKNNGQKTRTWQKNKSTHVTKNMNVK